MTPTAAESVSTSYCGLMLAQDSIIANNSRLEPVQGCLGVIDAKGQGQSQALNGFCRTSVLGNQDASKVYTTWSECKAYTCTEDSAPPRCSPAKKDRPMIPIPCKVSTVAILQHLCAPSSQPSPLTTNLVALRKRSASCPSINHHHQQHQ
jgi:hypothetical protein